MQVISCIYICSVCWICGETGFVDKYGFEYSSSFINVIHSAKEDYNYVRKLFMRQEYTPTRAGNQDFYKCNIILVLLSHLN